MDISELRKEKERLEDDILSHIHTALSDFRKLTGVKVNDLNLESQNLQVVGGKPEYHLINCVVTLDF